MTYRSWIDGVAWPAVQGGRAAELAALQVQFDECERWPAQRLRDNQFRQLSMLAEHARRTVPFYAEALLGAGFRPRALIDPTIWRRIPILTRERVRDLGARLHSTALPRAFGSTSTASSGGSTGVPVRVSKSAIDGLMWEAASVREIRWHGIDPSGDLATFKAELAAANADQVEAAHSGPGAELADWGAPFNLIWRTGRLYWMQGSQPIEKRARFLIDKRPKYLSARPAELRLLLAHFRENKLSLDSIGGVLTVSEAVDDSLRQACRETFGCEIVHNYSAAETGYLALQCPTNSTFHVMAETHFVEILNEDNEECAPGEIGRVVATPLHNYAMPLLRYEIGDEAERGPPCSCGRTSPAITQIIGRLEDYVVLKSGERRRVKFGHYKIAALEAVREFQLVQETIERLDFRLATSRALSETEFSLVRNVMDAAFGADFEVTISIHQALPRTPSGKLRAFVSKL